MHSEKAMKIKSTDPKTQGDFVIIDKVDFDPKIHTEYSEQEAKTETFDREAAKAALKEAGVEFPGNISNDKLKDLLAEQEAKTEGAE